MVHTQYIEDVFTGKVTQGLAADGFDNVLQGDEIKTTVLEVRLQPAMYSISPVGLGEPYFFSSSAAGA